MSFLILYDIKCGDNSTRLKVSRYLRKIEAEMLQYSVWEHTELPELQNLAKIIGENGGTALILKKKVISSVNISKKE